jgi:hypothetical protein
MDRRLWAALAAVLLALSLAGVAAAKGGALASLETPIPPDADPGTKIDVAWRAWMPDAGTDWPFSGLPVFIRLISADGGRSTETMGRESPAGSGRYEATIAVPSGGVRRVEVGLFGESCVDGTCTRSDLMFELPEDQRVPQSAAARQVAPVVPVATRAAPAPGRSLTTDTTPADPLANLPIAVAIMAAGVLLLVAAIGLGRRTRTSVGTARG